MNERRSNRRIRLLLGVFALVFAGTLGRAVWLQGVQASTLEQMASRQHQATTAIPAGRGTIFDRTGEPLAIGEQATTIYADPRSVKQPRRVALAAAKALGLNAETLYPLLADHSRHFVYVKRKADPAKAAELEKLKLPGLGFYAEELRYYPQRSVAAHVLGYAGIDNNGLEGLERSLDKSLIGKPGTQTTVTDPAGRVIDVISTKPERAGDDVFLTIDHRIQANAETVLRETVKKWGAKGGTAIVPADLPEEVMPQLEQRLTEFVDGRPGILSYTCGIDLGLHESNADFAIAATFDIPRENVRAICPYVGGGFGSKILTRDNAMLTVLAARLLKRPVKHMLTRQQMFMVVGLRQHNRQHMRLGADASGRLTGLGHDTVTHTSVHEEFVEQTGIISRMMYDVPNSQVTHRAFRLNVQTPKWTRAPGEAPGSFALESAMDELATQLKIDPLELRARNDARTDLDTGKPFGSRSLIECMRIGAERFGWSNRSPTPRNRRQGRWLVGYGMSAASRGAPHRGASANLLLTRSGRDVRAVVEMCATDLGTGSYTVIAQTAAETLGLPLDKVEVRLGDSALPPTPGSGGSWGANTFCTAALAVCEAAKQQLREKVSLRFVREPSVAELLQAAQLNEWRASNTATPGADIATWSHYAFGANFAEVWVDEDLGLVSVPRYLAVIAAGRILNPKTAASQIIGGIVWGIGNALMEESVLDERSGHFVTRTLADYHVPVNADIGDVQVLFAPETDTRVNRMGVKGVGEIGITSVAAAIANAVYNATGRRVRDLPITPDKLLTPMQA